jgi:hypothetical protein
MSLGFETTPGRKGATFARREALDPINLVARIMKEYPRAGVDEVCRRVRVALAGPDANYQDCFNDYATRNHFNILYKEEVSGPVRRSRPTKTLSAAQATAEKTTAATRADTIMETVKSIVLMELPTPFDKPLGDLTEAEGRRLTGWQSSLFAGIGNKRLRDAKSEAELRAAWKKSSRTAA